MRSWSARTRGKCLAAKTPRGAICCATVRRATRYEVACSYAIRIRCAHTRYAPTARERRKEKATDSFALRRCISRETLSASPPVLPLNAYSFLLFCKKEYAFHRPPRGSKSTDSSFIHRQKRVAAPARPSFAPSVFLNKSAARAFVGFAILPFKRLNSLKTRAFFDIIIV